MRESKQDSKKRIAKKLHFVQMIIYGTCAQKKPKENTAEAKPQLF